ncbi:PAS domain-containing sensor histidine kinase [Pelagicoccus albus]|uniref:histidine kinase n=1 Tax=Pelagicoccus albus TaxID=415222 RepID=A0A7X1B7F3_9BACT|nr:PAS domain-containing protein [Pelagicoccus albus]MBC2607047.1 PAS domain-containing protein [Pelagicoccus albus]
MSIPKPATNENNPFLWQKVLDTIPDPFFAQDSDGAIIAANDSAAKLFGVDRVAQLIGNSSFPYLVPELRALVERTEPVESLGEADSSQSSEIAVQFPDGTRTFEFKQNRLIDDTGNMIGTATLAKDITKNVEDKLQIELEREQLKTLIDNIPDPVFFKDTESRYLNGNAMFATCLRANSIEDVVGKTDFDFFDYDLARSFREDEKKIMESGVGVTQEEINISPDDKVRDYQTTKTPIFGSDSDSPIGLVGIARDITELKTAREELRTRATELSKTLDKLKYAQSQLVQSEKMASLGVLTAGIAHEINNPINFVYAGVHSIAKDFEDVRAVFKKTEQLPEAENPKLAIEELDQLKKEVGFHEAFTAIDETLVDIRLGAKRITEIVSGLSKFSRLGQESWDVTNLHEDIEGVLVLLKNKTKNNIRIERDFDPNLPALVCFPSKLNQALMNLISNAIDAIDDGPGKGCIRITTQAKEKTVVVSIADDGMGMEDNVKAKVFDPFFTTKRVGKGTGLGLAITYSIIQDHGGRISLESESGKGSVFTLEIPIEQNTEESQNSKPL